LESCDVSLGRTFEVMSEKCDGIRTWAEGILGIHKSL
jgi:hypothetical protein